MRTASVFWISFCLLIVGCKQQTTYNEAEMVDAKEATVMISQSEAYNLLFKEKLEAYINTQQLAQQHPEFQTDTLVHRLPMDLKAIQEVVLLDSLYTTDTHTKNGLLLVYYQDYHQVDTIGVTVTRNELQVEDEQLTTIQVDFFAVKDSL